MPSFYITDLSDLFYKFATLQDDMAKRILLSVIPSVMSPTQRNNIVVDNKFWGIDQKALKSAVYGAKDLIKYGAGICLDELKHYGDPLKSMLKDERIRDTKSIEKLEKLYRPYSNLYSKAQFNLLNGNYKECLKLCIYGFLDDNPVNDFAPWGTAYGGKNWANIAKVLYDIADKWGQLKVLKEPGTKKPDDALEQEIQLMKDIIVNMNVFDNLAHNTGSVMPKLINKELDLNPISLNLDDQVEYKDSILRLMDSKELDNPMEVFKEIAPIIDNTSQKHLFNDWIKKITTHPEYNNLPSDEERSKNLTKIKYKKIIIQHFENYYQFYENKLKTKKEIYLSNRRNLDNLSSIIRTAEQILVNEYDFAAIIQDTIYTFGQETIISITSYLKTIYNLAKDLLSSAKDLQYWTANGKVWSGSYHNKVEADYESVVPEKFLKEIDAVCHAIDTLKTMVQAL